MLCPSDFQFAVDYRSVSQMNIPPLITYTVHGATSTATTVLGEARSVDAVAGTRSGRVGLGDRFREVGAIVVVSFRRTYGLSRRLFYFLPKLWSFFLGPRDQAHTLSSPLLRQ